MTKLPYDVVEIDEDHVVATAPNMLFMIWRRRTVAAAFRRATAAMKTLAVQSPGGIGVCQVVEQESVPPDNEARAAFQEYLRLKDVSHGTLIHEGAGFKAASVRAVMAGVMALARPVFRLNICSSVNEATRFHSQMLEKQGRHETAEEIASVVQALRTLHRERFP
ncbi:MAG: hypothetical protein IPG04_22410 [Polyangiaceae bacterium]|nr:hypothetical protein [Polyangiaceae bacterium]